MILMNAAQVIDSLLYIDLLDFFGNTLVYSEVLF